MSRLLHERKLSIAIFGCGGTGSELIKLLRRHTLTLVDFDKIELSNLNRQFLYTKDDCGRYKAEVAAQKIGCKYRVCRLEELSPEDLDEYNLIVSCLDSTGSRMELNYLFKQSKAALFVDCGVEGLRAHVKKVDKENACLYCIKDLYSTRNETYLCSLADTGSEISDFNREKILKSIIFKEKEMLSVERGELEGVIERIVRKFNERAKPNTELETCEFEVNGYFHNIIPNVSVINSICASLVVLIIFGETEHDFIFYEGTSQPSLRKLKLEKSSDCLCCRMGSYSKDALK